MKVDVAACRAQAARYEVQAAELPEGSEKRAELLRDAAELRADAERGYSSGLMQCGRPFVGGRSGKELTSR